MLVTWLAPPPPHLLLLYTLPAPILVSLPATPRTRANCSLTRPKPRAPKQQKQQQSTTPLQQKKRFLFSVSKKLPHDYSENIDWTWKLTTETRPTCDFSLAQSSQSLLWLTITQDQSTCSVSKASGASQNTLILERTKRTNKRTKQTNKQTNKRTSTSTLHEASRLFSHHLAWHLWVSGGDEDAGAVSAGLDPRPSRLTDTKT